MESRMDTPFRKLRLLEWLTILLAVCVLMAQNASPQALTQSPQPAETQSNTAIQPAPERSVAQQLVIPAGTLIVLRLDSPLNSESANKGSGVYAETVFPVIVDNHVVIPARTFVQGTVTAEKRGGRFDRKSAIAMHFTNLVLGSSYTVAMDGNLRSIPGAKEIRADDVGDVKRTDQLDQALPKVAGAGVAGAVLGSVRHSGVGMLPGAGLGAALGLGSVLIMRGDSVHLAEGQKLEMVLNAPLTVDAAQVKQALQRGGAAFGGDMRGRDGDDARRTPALKPRPTAIPLSRLSPLSLVGLLRH